MTGDFSETKEDNNQKQVMQDFSHQEVHKDIDEPDVTQERVKRVVDHQDDDKQNLVQDLVQDLVHQGTDKQDIKKDVQQEDEQDVGQEVKQVVDNQDITQGLFVHQDADNQDVKQVVGQDADEQQAKQLVDHQESTHEESKQDDQQEGKQVGLVVKDEQEASDEVKLNDLQNTVVERVSAFQNVFMTGSAGSGKSEVIKYIKKLLGSKVVHVTAMTGRASLLIGGKTLHSWAGIGLGQGTWEELVQDMSFNAKKNWRQKELVLVVDEVSMLSHELFEKLDNIGKYFRRSALPFGGITLLFSGDFKQLPPVKADLLLKSKLFMETFPTSSTVLLTTNFRQEGDPVYQGVLHRISLGEQTKEDEAILASRMLSIVKPPPGSCFTRIYPLKRQAESFNAAKMKGLKGKEYEFLHSYSTLAKNGLSSQERTYLEKQLANAPCEARLVLKVGAVVMQVVNCTPDGATRRKVNGSIGVVEAFDETSNNPVVRFHDKDLCEIKPYSWVSEDKKLSRSQLPLIIAWGVTAHKIQGASLDAAVMSLGSNIFEDNQAYVMLSRVKTLEGVFLSSFDPSVVRAHPDAVAYYKMLEQHFNQASRSASKSKAPCNQSVCTKRVRV